MSKPMRSKALMSLAALASGVMLLWGQADAATRILPLGDSRVQGGRPEFESYRYELWKRLVTEGADIDLIGPRFDDAPYRPFMGEPFDRNHAGVGGFTTADVLSTLNDTLDMIEVPDVVLLGIGGNDLLAGIPVRTAVTNVVAIINLLRERNPEVSVIVEQIAPGRSDIMTAQLTASFNAFNQGVATAAQRLSTARSPVLAVDMAEGWFDRNMADEVHYNVRGAIVVANRYLEALLPQIQPTQIWAANLQRSTAHEGP
ncbi:MAG: GDSL-type esterase/lipase family protein [Pseudomonadota bacterium]